MASRSDSNCSGKNMGGGFIILVLLVPMAGCGPVPTDEVLRSGATAGASAALVPRTEAGNSQPAEVSGPAQSPPSQDTFRDQAEPLVVPAWVANDLASSDVHVKLQALDRWGNYASVGAVHPVIAALEDEDERVQARALQLLVQDWQRAQAAEPAAGQWRETNDEGR